MTQIVTIVAGVNPDLDDANDLAIELVQSGELQPFESGYATQPAPEDDGLSVNCPSENVEEVKRKFREAGFRIVGGGD